MATHLELVQQDNYKMYAAIQRVRELHKAYNPYGVVYLCGECFDSEYGSDPYPCQTIKALDGDD